MSNGLQNGEGSINFVPRGADGLFSSLKASVDGLRVNSSDLANIKTALFNGVQIEAAAEHPRLDIAAKEPNHLWAHDDALSGRQSSCSGSDAKAASKFSEIEAVSMAQPGDVQTEEVKHEWQILADRISDAIANQSQNLDLDGIAVEHPDELKALFTTAVDVAAKHDKIVEKLMTEKNRSSADSCASFVAEYRDSVSQAMEEFVVHLKRLSLDERAAIFTAMCGNKISAVFQAGRHGIASEFLSMISELKDHNKGKTLVTLLTRHNEDGYILPMRFTYSSYSEKNSETILEIISSLSRDDQAKILKMTNNDSANLPIILMRTVDPRKIFGIIRTLEKSDQIEILKTQQCNGMTLALEAGYSVKYQKMAIDEFLCTVEQLDLDEDAFTVIFAGQNKDGVTFPMCIHRSGLELFGRFLKIFFKSKILNFGSENLNQKAIERLFIPEENCKMCLSALIALHASDEDFGQFLDIIQSLPRDLRVKIFMARSKSPIPVVDSEEKSSYYSLPLSVNYSKLSFLPRITRMIYELYLDQDDQDDQDALAEILTIRNRDYLNFPTIVASKCKDRDTIHYLMEMIERLHIDALAKLLVNKSYLGNFPTCMTTCGIGNFKRIIAMLKKLEKHDNGNTIASILTNRSFGSEFMVFALNDIENKKYIITELIGILGRTKFENKADVMAKIFLSNFPVSFMKAITKIENGESDSKLGVTPGLEKQIEKFFKMIESIKKHDDGSTLEKILSTTMLPIYVFSYSKPSHVSRIFKLIETLVPARKIAVQKAISSLRCPEGKSILQVLEGRREQLGSEVLDAAFATFGVSGAKGTFSYEFKKFSNGQKNPDSPESKKLLDANVAVIEAIGTLRYKLLDRRESIDCKVSDSGLAVLDEINAWLCEVKPFTDLNLLENLVSTIKKAEGYTDACADAMRVCVDILKTDFKIIKLAIDNDAPLSDKVAILGNNWLTGIVHSTLDKISLAMDNAVGGHQGLCTVEVSVLFANMRNAINGLAEFGISHSAAAEGTIVYLAKFIKNPAEAEKDQSARTAIFAPHKSYYDLRNHLLNGPNGEFFTEKLKRIKEVCPFGCQIAGGKLMVDFNTVEPVAMLMFAAMERESLARNIGVGSGAFESLVDINKITVSELPEKIEIDSSEKTAAKSGDDFPPMEILNPREIFHAAMEEVATLIKNKVDNKRKSVSGENLKKMSKLLTKLEAVKTDQSPATFGLVEEIISLYCEGILDLDLASDSNFCKLTRADVKKHISLAVLHGEIDKFVAKCTI